MWKLLMNEDVREDHIAQVVTIAWALWRNRNEVRCGGVRKLGQQIFRWVSDYLREYKAAVVQDNPVPSMPQQGVVWAPSWGGHFKINVDGAVFTK